jgi:hypothetical protein
LCDTLDQHLAHDICSQQGGDLSADFGAGRGAGAVSQRGNEDGWMGNIFLMDPAYEGVLTRQSL